MNSKAYPQIITDRLVLRKPTKTDIAKLLEYLVPGEVQETVQIPFPYEEKDAVWWINAADEHFNEGKSYIFAIAHKQLHHLIGGIGLHLQSNEQLALVGYWLGKPFWNMGIMSEALQAVINFGFKELNLHKIYAQHFHFNEASGRVMQKCGMQKEAEMKDHLFFKGAWVNLIQYGVINTG